MSKFRLATACLVSFLGVQLAAQQQDSPSLTVYNQNFAVVRESIPLDLTVGLNHVLFSNITAHVEPDSVVLRDPRGGRLDILEQDYRNDPISENLLLSLFEGKIIDFDQGKDKEGKSTIVKGRIVRSGYVPHVDAYQRYGQQYYQQQASMGQTGSGQPIIEVDGRLQFGLPGRPLFPSLGVDTILKPTLDWQLESAEAGRRTAELSYVSGGMSWHADYNIVAPEKGDVVDIVAWVTLDNQSGKTFDNAHIKLMAGEVAKIQPASGYATGIGTAVGVVGINAPSITEKTFDEYHLYNLPRPATLRDREVKQVEFLRAHDVKTEKIYVYDGMKVSQQYRNWNPENIRNAGEYGIETNRKVWVMLEMRNSKNNGLGMPMPMGRVRFYRRNQDGQLEFTGEDKIDHTPSDEMVRFNTGNAFDIVGERRRTSFKNSAQDRWVDESFEIRLRNHKTAPVDVRVVEHLYRWTNWLIQQKTDDYKQTDSQTIEFNVQVPPDKEKIISYAVHYSW